MADTCTLQPKEVKPGVYDWSTVHQPTGELFKSVKDPAEWKQFFLPQEKVEQFWRDGYLLNMPVLTPEECDALLNEYKHFTGEREKHASHELLYEFHSNQSGDPKNVLVHGLGQWRLTKLFHDLVFLPQVIAPVSQLLVEGSGPVPVRFWHDQLFAKPPKCGGIVAWHQDYSYWTRTKPQMHMTIHIALDDQTLDNGPLMYVQGSHRWTRDGGPLPVLDFNFADADSFQSILTEEEKQAFKPKPAMLKKGEASFHQSLTVHGSQPNRSDHSRRATVLNYFADGVYSDSDKDQIGGCIVPKGQKMEGQFFPIVFDPKWAED